MRLIVAVTIALALWSGLGAVASAQTGSPFVPHQNWYTDAFGVGVAPDGAGNLWVEVDGIPGITAGDHTHPVPPEADQGLSPARNYRLSPTRRHLYVFGTANGSPGTRMYLYEVPAVDGAPLVFVAGGLGFIDGIAFQGFFDQVGLPPLFFAVSISGSSPTQRIYWVNLESGVGGFTNDLPPSVQAPLHLAPNGIAAFVQHDGTFAGQSTYRLIELCDDDLGAPLNPTGSPFDDLPSPVAAAYLAGDAVNGYTAEVVWNGAVLGSAPLDDCSGASPIVGACCVDGGCVSGLTEAACTDQGGTWEGAGVDCATVECPQPPAPQLQLVASGPTEATMYTPITYTLEVTNTGTAAAEQVYLVAPLPTGATFVSVSAPGFYDPGDRRAFWFLGTLAAGASVTETVTVAAGCAASQLTFTNHRVTATGLAAVFGQAVVTVILQASGSPDVDITAVASADPLGNDDTVVYTVDLFSAGQVRPGVTFSGLYGDHVVVDALVDAGGGDFSHNGAGFSWTGDLPASSPVQVAFRVRVLECRPEYPPTTTLNFGNQITFYGACADAFAFLTPPPSLTVAPPDLATTLTVTPPVPARVIGLDWNLPTLVRPDDPFDVEWIVTNRGSGSQDVSAAVCDLGGLAPAADPPFLGTPPAGVVWDGAGNRITWSGSLAPSDTLRVRFQALVPTGASCRQFIGANVAKVGCPQAALASAAVVPVPEAWADGHLAQAASNGTIGRLRPGVDAELDPWICLSTEYTSSLTAAPGGALWLSGLPNLRIDPATLEFWALGYGFFTQVGVTTIWAIAEDAAGLVYLGGAVDVGGDPRVSVVVWDPVADTSSLLWQEQTGSVGDISQIRSLHLGDDGLLALATPEGVVRLDTAEPAAAVIWNDPLVTMGYGALDRLPDGRFVTSDQVWGSGVEVLAGIDPVSGAHAALVADLNAPAGHDTSPYWALAADDSNHVYLAAQFGRIMQVDLDDVDPLPLAITLQSDSHGGLAWLGAGGGQTGVDDLPGLPTALVLHGAAPNPFNPRTTVRFDLPRPGPVRLDLFDLRGRRVTTLVDRELTAGSHAVSWVGTDQDGRNAPSGLYLARLVAGDQVRTAKLLLAR